MEELLQELNANQREAVLYCDGPSLVIAGAGSGKTRVLTYKIAHLLTQGYNPYNILALTFTNKAAREMKERVALMVGQSIAMRLWMGTFHSVFSRILRANAELIGFTSNFTIYDSADSKSLIRTIVKEMGLDEKVYKPSTVQSIISNAKNALITPNAYAANKELLDIDFRSKRPEIHAIYKSYWVRSFRAGAMDFDDLLLYTNILFRDHPDVLERYQRLFSYILVDEYQDTNFAQHLIVRQLSKSHNHLCVVGDDAQSIYSFRGANISNILNIKNDYPDCRIFKLEQNYRSTQNIVDAANSLIKKNKGQIAKNVFSENEKGDKIAVLNAYSDFEEGYLIANKISEMRTGRHLEFSDFAILYRTNAQSRIFEEALRKRNIPYRIYGGLSFYQRKEIKDIIAYFRLAVNPKDEEALKRVINYPARGIGDTTLSKIGICATANNISHWEVLFDPLSYALPVNNGTLAKLNNFRDLVISFSEDAGKKNVLELAEQIIKQSGIFSDVYVDRSPENLSKQENIQEMMNGIQEFCMSRQEEGREDVGLVDFLSEISLATDQDKNDENDLEKVTMMTIHASKGLEFNTVFVVGLEEDLFPAAMSKNSEQDIEEERRLFYVAITRARQNCVLSYAGTRYRNGQTMAFPPSRFLKDIDVQYLNLPANNLFGGEMHSQSRDFSGRHSIENTPFAGQKFDSHHQSADRKYGITDRADHDRVSPRSKLSRISSGTGDMKTSVTTTQGDLVVGNIIKHDRFGVGHISAIEGVGDNCKISVEFENVGKKQLLLRFAKFSILK